MSSGASTPDRRIADVPRTKTTLWVGALIILMIPPAVFLWAAFESGLGGGQSFAALAAQYSADMANLSVCSLLGLVPWALLTGVLWVMRWAAPSNRARPVLAIGGLLPILLVLVWINHDYWRLFLPSRTYPGFPHGLGFIIGPAVFAPGAMAVGMLISWLLFRLRG